MKRPYSGIFATQTPVSAYIAGLIAADGCLSINKRNYKYVRLSSIDLDLLECVQKYTGGSIYTYRKEHHHWFVLQLNGKDCFDDLFKRWNMTPRKSLTYEPPELRESLVSHFIRGYFDGDGSIHRDTKGNLRFSIFSGSRILLEFLYTTLCDVCNSKSSMYTNKSGLYFKISGNKKVKKVLSYLYRNCGDCFLVRKDITKASENSLR